MPVLRRNRNDRSGSFSTELVWTKRSLRSAMPSIATEFMRHDESSRSANRVILRRGEQGQHAITASPTR
jgi:hypothetical protein